MKDSKILNSNLCLPFSFTTKQVLTPEEVAILSNNKDVIEVFLEDLNIRLSKRIYMIAKEEDEKIRGEIRAYQTLISMYTQAFFPERLVEEEENTNSNI